jgi:3-demethylubiquinone-9 3-methyltransferase
LNATAKASLRRQTRNRASQPRCGAGSQIAPCRQREIGMTWRRWRNAKDHPFLWFDNQAEEAMNHYLSIFKNSRILSVSRANGKVLSGTFELEGQEFIALNAGPQFKFTGSNIIFRQLVRARGN